MRIARRYGLAFAASLSLALLATGLTPVSIAAQPGQKSTNPGKARKKVAAFVHREDEGKPGRGLKKPRRPQDPAVIDVYKDFNAWWDDDRDGATLMALGKVQGIDHFVHSVAELADGISPQTDVVLITSNSWGQESTRRAQNHPQAQMNLDAFVRRGGVAIVDMGDNDYAGGFMAPGAFGTPDLVFPTAAANATLSVEASGDDGVLGSADDHRLVRGPDGVATTGDDLDNANIDACCYVAHGNLADGVVLPPGATVLMTADFDGAAKPILAEFCLGYGRVIVDTVTKEFAGHDPEGQGASRFMLSLLSYAMDPGAHTGCQVNGLIESVRWMQGAAAAQPLEKMLLLARDRIERGKYAAASSRLRAFAKAVGARRGRSVPVQLADEWIRMVRTIQDALRR